MPRRTLTWSLGRRTGSWSAWATAGKGFTTGNIALFSHGGSSTAALSRIMNLSFPYLCSLLHMPFTAICVLRFDPKPDSLCLPHLELAGDAKHTENI